MQDSADNPNGETGAARQRRRKVLVVDPDERVLSFAAEALSSFRPGFDVATARDTEHAAQWLDSFEPDLLLLGLDEGSENGTGRTAALLEDPRTRRCRLVLLGNRPRGTTGERNSTVLDRPLRLQALLDAVRDLDAESG